MGQQGGAGGKGYSGFRFRDAVSAAHGGAGGCGGNGGNGGAGGQGGTVKVYFTHLECADGKTRLAVSVIGGGGNGGQAGKGGRGGDGGTPEAGASYHDTSHFLAGDRRVDGAASGGGGICGVPGFGGPPGPYGEATYGLPFNVSAPGTDEERTELTLYTRTFLTSAPPGVSPKTGDDGTAFKDPNDVAAAGTPGSAAAYVFAYGVPGATEGSKGAVGQPNRTRKPKAARVSPPGGPVNTYSQPQIGCADLAAAADAEQLDMLFDHVRTRYLLTDIERSPTIGADLMAPLQWLIVMAGAKDQTALSASASATLRALTSRCNIFGKDAQFAALGSLDEYKDALKAALPLFTEVQNAYVQLSAAVHDAAQRKAYLDNVLRHQDTLLGKLTMGEKEHLDALADAAAQIRALDDSRLDRAKSLGQDFDSLSKDIRTAIGLSASDFFGMFNQLSFTNRELTNVAGGLALGGAAAAGAMLLSQAGDMALKAVENVTTDTGASLNKNFIIRRMESLAKDVRDIPSLKMAREGLIKMDPNAEYRLQTTREQVESICSNFYESYPGAKKIAASLDAYIDAVTARNEKVEEYNQLLSDLCYMRAEAANVRAQQAQTSAVLQGSASPGLPTMARFAAAQYRHAREQCIELLYTASRVYTMQTLDVYDVFSGVLGRLTSAGDSDLNTAALDTGLIDLISQELTKKQKRKTSVEPFVPGGDRCSVTLTPSEYRRPAYRRRRPPS